MDRLFPAFSDLTLSTQSSLCIAILFYLKNSFMNIFVSNLSFQAMDHDIRKLFGEFGEVVSAKVITDNFTRRSRGFGFVEMSNGEDAQNAIAGLNNTSFMQKTIIVREATSKPRL